MHSSPNDTSVGPSIMSVLILSQYASTNMPSALTDCGLLQVNINLDNSDAGLLCLSCLKRTRATTTCRVSFSVQLKAPVFPSLTTSLLSPSPVHSTTIPPPKKRDSERQKEKVRGMKQKASNKQKREGWGGGGGGREIKERTMFLLLFISLPLLKSTANQQI